MYTPRAFALDDLPELHQLIQHTRLAQLVTVGEQGLQASHLPLLLKHDEGPMAPSTGTWPRPTGNGRTCRAAARPW